VKTEVYRLHLEKDKDIPRFKRLHFEKEKVSLTKVLTKGIHPHLLAHDRYGGGDSHVVETILKILNQDEFWVGQLKDLGYCYKIVPWVRPYYYGSEEESLENNLERIRQSIYFVEKLNFEELLEIAKGELRKNWSYEVVRELLRSCFRHFNDLRSFLKGKKKEIKLKGYEDLEKYELHRILKLDDFLGKEKILISQGLPITNFRSPRFLKKITTEEGFICLMGKIKDFQLTWEITLERKDSQLVWETMLEKEDKQEAFELVYYCQHDQGRIRLIPNLDSKENKRLVARKIAKSFSKDQGRYCFTVSFTTLEKMVDQASCKIIFPTLNYKDPMPPSVSSAKLAMRKIRRYTVGGFVTETYTNEDMQWILRNHQRKVSGKKEELVERLIDLAVDIYRQRKAELDSYFSKRKFLKIPRCRNDEGEFPLLTDLDLRNLILSMYCLKHIRANTILEKDYENETYPIKDLARALITKRLTLEGSFLKVE